MFHLGRSGSTVLGGLLGSHSSVFWAGEIYARVFAQWKWSNGGVQTTGAMPRDPIDYLRRDERRALHRSYGFEAKPFHLDLIGHTPASFVGALDTLGFESFIVLDRRNRLRKVVSSVIAQENKQMLHVRAGSSPVLHRVHIDIDRIAIDFGEQSLLGWLQTYDRQMLELDEALANRRVLRLTYEDDIEQDPTRAYDKVCHLLGLRPQSTTPRVGRTNPFPLVDIIENFDEVERALSESPFSWMLEG